MPVFMPVRITADVPSSDRLALSSPRSTVSKAAPTEADRIEIALPDGTCIRVGADVGLVALRRVMTAVRTRTSAVQAYNHAATVLGNQRAGVKLANNIRHERAQSLLPCPSRRRRWPADWLWPRIDLRSETGSPA